MSVLLTGHSGFLGGYLFDGLDKLFDVKTLSRFNADINCDLSNSCPTINFKPKMVVHNAGLAHFVPRNHRQSQMFYDINLEGTKNLCRAFNNLNMPEKFIFISTVSVYGQEAGELINEELPCKPKSAYAKSKWEAEKFLIDWANQYSVQLTILRLPLVTGKNPPGNLGAMINAIRKGYYVSVGNGQAKRSMVLANDVAKFIAGLPKDGIFNLTDGHHPSFLEIENAITTKFNKRKPIALPFLLLKVMAKFGDALPLPINSNKLLKMSSSLTFDSAKAQLQQAWQPASALDFLNDF